MKSIYHKEERKNWIKNQSLQLKGNRNFNPRVARYRSHRGITLDKHDMNLNIAIQIIPIIVLVAILITRSFI